MRPIERFRATSPASHLTHLYFRPSAATGAASRRPFVLTVLVLILLAAPGCGPAGGDDGEWSRAERESVAEFISGLEALREGISVLNAAAPDGLSEEEREQALEHLRRARERTAAISDSVLTKIHPELPVRVHDRLRRGIDDRIRSLEGAHPYRMLSSNTRLNDWAEWYDRTRSDWNLPGR